MSKFMEPSFSVGSNDKPAARRYSDRYEHSTGKCGDNIDCEVCSDEENREKVTRRVDRMNNPRPRIRIPSCLR